MERLNEIYSEISPNNKVFPNYNRKEKSLGELSKKFLMMFGKIDECVISLDCVTQQLGIDLLKIPYKVVKRSGKKKDI